MLDKSVEKLGRSWVEASAGCGEKVYKTLLTHTFKILTKSYAMVIQAFYTGLTHRFITVINSLDSMFVHPFHSAYKNYIYK
jgi:hypothetical protein